MGRGGAKQERTNEEEAWVEEELQLVGVEEELQLVGVEEEESSTVSSPLSPSSSLVFPQAFSSETQFSLFRLPRRRSRD